MTIWLKLAIVFGGYLLGSVPFGFIIVKLTTGQDVRTIQSGRTGGTNTLRAAGPWAGLLTGALDVIKNIAVVMIARQLAPMDYWLQVLAATAGILGHNYSLYLIHRDGKERLRFFGGAGGSASLGGAMGFWPPAGLIIVVLGILVWYFVGYASITTLSIAALATIIFTLRALAGAAPWEYVAYGLISLGLVTWSLRPNIQRLREGTERLHGWRARNLPNEEKSS
jgi:glycerol-3-phosphate acyltransferase PlsY